MQVMPSSRISNDYKGFSEYVDISHITDNCIFELILMNWGYRYVDGFINSNTMEDKEKKLKSLQKIYEIGKKIWM